MELRRHLLATVPLSKVLAHSDGMWRILPFTRPSCSLDIGPCVAPRSTAPSMTWRTPPPEAIGWGFAPPAAFML
jgi:hypothetical protein